MIPKRTDTALLTVTQIRELENALFAYQDSYVVMQTAAQALFDVIITDNPIPTFTQTVHIILGPGNNAGDGLVVAGLLKQAGFSVVAYTLFHSGFLGDTAKAYQFAKQKKVSIVPFYPFQIHQQDIIIEAIFGIGLNKPANGVAQSAIIHLNACKRDNPSIFVYAIDIPAGILSNTGVALGQATNADKTVTFIANKIGLHTSDGKACAGQVIVKTLGIKQQPSSNISTFLYDFSEPQLSIYRNTHKGDYGHVLITGGGKGMFGAVALSAVSALKSGTGKASILAHPKYDNQYHLDNTPLYEVMRCHQPHHLIPYSTVVLGPGLGRDDWGKQLFNTILSTITPAKPLLIDADGLWHLANINAYPIISVITPHEAEAAKLLAITLENLRENKRCAVKQLAKKYRCIAVLKGAGTLISDGKTVWINATGNVCLATAGTGDILAGIIGGYLAQGFSPLDASLYGVYRHSLAADQYWSIYRNKTLKASDLWDYLS
ncbi:MAG: NAD(P)H-hydrate dehydratase [Ostreibacterium sp.]